MDKKKWFSIIADLLRLIAAALAGAAGGAVL